jgi:predicted Kef-type K+ transport protein
MTEVFGICLSLVYVAPSVGLCKLACTICSLYLVVDLRSKTTAVAALQNDTSLVFGICLSLIVCVTICRRSRTHGFFCADHGHFAF